MTDMTIFVPTRGRTTSAVCLQEVFEDTCQGNTEVIFISSTDDEYHEDYKALNRLGILNKLICVTPRKRGMADPLNLGFRKWLEDPRVFPSYAVGFMGDDHRPRTQGWDLEYIRALTALSGRSRDRSKPGVGMVYGDDLLQGEDLPTQIAMTTNIPTILGRMVPDQLSHLYTDTYWLELGKKLNKITYLPEVIVEHMHPGAGKAHVDVGYAYSGSASLDLSDRSIFEGIIEPLVIPEDVKKIKRLM
jgi:hypothetical protein